MQAGQKSNIIEFPRPVHGVITSIDDPCYKEAQKLASEKTKFQGCYYHKFCVETANLSRKLVDTYIRPYRMLDSSERDQIAIAQIKGHIKAKRNRLDEIVSELALETSLHLRENQKLDFYLFKCQDSEIGKSIRKAETFPELVKEITYICLEYENTRDKKIAFNETHNRARRKIWAY